MHSYPPYHLTNDVYRPYTVPYTPLLCYILSYHFGPAGTGPISPSGHQFLNSVAPGFMPNPPQYSTPHPRISYHHHPHYHIYRDEYPPWVPPQYHDYNYVYPYHHTRRRGHGHH
ncbi:uncharacterized protein F4822DRAFT_301117 [Hypoxylon trugodes]|uniref:uncharacterized protein n=1 Tax=Hypoxylon trugodes TaxID=326681 RepID=UPI002192F964|nr:uncharacterized protein F4822DRAFT_301117 [Hypoxylon trugodes]KAI1388059.1 hypothetical protein F4822DRAFT_301117 [Hypoxylon trugodes]